MTIVRPYLSSDYRMLCRWLEHYEIPNPDPEYFSDMGFVVNGRAIGFLFRTPSKSCYIDHVAADPHSNALDRHASLQLLFEVLEQVAKDDGFKMITALARLPAMKSHFQNRGYDAFGDFTLFYKYLKGN